MKALTTIALATSLGVSSLPVHTAPARRGIDPTPELKRQLHALVTAQEVYFADHGTYTTDVSALGFFKPHRARVTAADSVWVNVVQAGGRSWWGRAVPFGKNKSCVLYVGFLADFTAPP